MIQSDTKSVVSGETLPAECASGFDRHALFAGGRKNAVAVFLILSEEKFPGRHGNHADAASGLTQNMRRAKRGIDLGSGRNEDRVIRGILGNDVRTL